MLKGRGVSGTITTRSPIPRESLDRGLSLQNDKACTYKVVNSSASRQQIRVECQYQSLLRHRMDLRRLRQRKAKPGQIKRIVGHCNNRFKPRVTI